MKKAVAFLLAFLIFVIPMTTLVKADVVIGDNDNTIINENATILGRKLALMESLSDLALSGVTEYTISNTNDVDSYLDYLWDELNNAIESLSDGTGFIEISNNLKSKYFTNLVQYKDYITNRGNYLAELLPSGNPTTSLLKTFFANNIYGKQYTQHYDLALDMFRSLSALNNGSNIDVPPNLAPYINAINGDVGDGHDFFWKTYNFSFSQSSTTFPCYTKSYFVPNSYKDNGSYSIVTSNFHTNEFNASNNIARIDLDYVSNDTYSITLSNYSLLMWYSNLTFAMTANQNGLSVRSANSNGSSWSNGIIHNGTLTNCLNWLVKNMRNVDIYMNNDPISLVSGGTSNPIIDIDGFMKIYGNDHPQQYELQPNTKIDYDQLYQVIYNAIRNNLPISQGDINYYDSHDTIYSPTIINNNGEEEGQESDLIDTILDYAVIPKFDTAIAQPMRAALTNGVVIMNNSITNVIPNEILLILGACFFLLLFAVVINRMIK